jgi:hypothetical protein
MRPGLGGGPARVRAVLRAVLVFVTCVGLSGGMLSTRAAAQAAPAEAAPAADARELFRRGEAAYSAGNYDLAIREWNSAYSVDPRPRIQFNLSQAYERLGHLEQAMDALKKFLDSGDPDDPMYSDANARLSALQQRLALTGVVVNGGHEGGSITVDEKDWGRTPRPDKIPVAPGSHVLVVRWPGRPEFRTNVAVPAGQVIEVNLPSDAGTPVAAGPVNTTVDTDDGKKSPVLWYALGGGLAAAGVGGIVYGVVRGGAASDCGGDTYCNPDDEDAASTQSLVGYIAGGVLLAGGGTLITLAALGVLGGDGDEGEKQAGTTCGIGFASATCRIRF